MQLSMGLGKAEDTALWVMGAAMAAIVAIQVACRYLFNASLFWSEEAARYLLIWLTFVGAAAAFRRGAHPRVTALVGRLPAPARPVMARLADLVSTGLFIGMIVWGTQFAWFVRHQTTPALGLPKWMVMAALPVGGLCLSIHAMAGLTRRRSP